MARDQYIRLRVSESEKQEIEDFVEGVPEYSDVSDFFRTLAHTEMATYGEDDTTIDPEEIVNAVEIGLSGVNEQLENFNDRLAQVESEVRSSDDIGNLAQEIFSDLPALAEDEELPDPTEIEKANPESIELVQQISTANAWANYYNEDEDRIRRALARMLQYYPDAEYQEDEYQSRRYYRVKN